jgi:uncharacterized protein (DUF2062 family)
MPLNQISLTRFWRDRVLRLIIAQLVQGVTPQKIALTIAVGASLGVFPILGATTLLCAVAGVWLKLNQPVIQMINWIISPLQLSLILVFVRIGEWIVGAPPVSFSVPELIQKFHESPANFFQQFGMTGVYGMIAWLLITPFLAVTLYCILVPPLKKLAALKAAFSHSRHVE